MPHKGYIQTIEHRAKVSRALKGRKGHIPWNKGKPLLYETRQKISLAHKGLGKGIPYEVRYGVEKAREIKEKLQEHFSQHNPGLEKIRTLPHGMLGKHHLEETRQKISLKLKGNNNCGSGINNSFYGKHHSPKFIKARRKAWTGKGNPMYHDGKCLDLYPLAFNDELRRVIRARDHYICQLCGIGENGRKHTCHHIDYDKKHNIETNLITLCTPCNSKVNKDRDLWQAYFIDLLTIRGIAKEGTGNEEVSNNTY